MEEIRSTDATPQRPEGERILDAAMTEIDINDFISQLKSESTWKDSDRNSITVHKSMHFVQVLIGLHKGAELKPHKAGGILSLQVLEGSIEFILEQKTAAMKKGNMLVLHEDIYHSVKALEESFLLLSIAKALKS